MESYTNRTMSTEDVSDSESVKAEHVTDLIDAFVGRLNQEPTFHFAAMLSHALHVIAHGGPLSSNVDEGGTVFRLAELIRGQFETPNDDFPLHSMELTAANLARIARTSVPMSIYHPRFIHVVDLIVHSIYSHPPRMWGWVQMPPRGVCRRVRISGTGRRRRRSLWRASPTMLLCRRRVGWEIGVGVEILQWAVDLVVDLGLRGRRLRAKRKMGVAAKDVECQGPGVKERFTGTCLGMHVYSPVVREGPGSGTGLVNSAKKNNYQSIYPTHPILKHP
jgi:hypothetical protein